MVYNLQLKRKKKGYHKGLESQKQKLVLGGFNMVYVEEYGK